MKKLAIIMILFSFLGTIIACDFPGKQQVIFTGIEDKTILLNSVFDPLAGVTAVDKETGDITSSIVVTGTVDTSKEGEYIIKYTVNSSTGKVIIKNRTIKVVQFASESDVLALISDYVTEDTEDNLVTEIFGKPVTWRSSNNGLYTINNYKGTVNKARQKHQEQIVTVSASIENSDGTTSFYEKEITIGPITFGTLRPTPVATYFSTGPMSTYKAYNERYKTDGTLFSDTTKEILDIVYYAFVEFDQEANVVLQGGYVEDIAKLRAHNVRAIFCVAGVSGAGSRNFNTVCSSGELRAKFIQNLMDLVDENNFDGIDIDWETADGYPVRAVPLNALARDLKAEMNRRQADGGSPYLLSAAVPASSWGTSSDRFDFPTLNQYLDHINLMSYDMNSTAKTTHLSPLYKSSYDGGFGFGVDYGVELLGRLGFDKSKIIVGSAGYGKAYNVTGSSIHNDLPFLGVNGTLTSIPGISGSYPTGTLFGNGIQELLKTGRYVVYHEYNTSNQFVGSYLYSESDGIFVTYDSAKSISEKYRYALKTAGQGIMFWCYGEDPADIIVDTMYDEYMRSQM